MNKTIRLNDLQLVLLSKAATRDNGSVIPLPENCAQDMSRIGRAVASLLKRGLIEELPMTDRSLAWREEDQDIIGLFISAAGRAAIGVREQEDARAPEADQSNDAIGRDENDSDHTGAGEDAVPYNSPSEAAPSALPGSKIGAVVALLERAEGATLDEMIEATGWLPHTTRAALTGLRKKGYTISRGKRGEVTCYHLASSQAQ